MKIGPSAEDLRNRYEYHLDFPGDALNAGCDYERWSRRLAAGSEPTVYAHVATEAGRPGKLALQYWIFYAFNDFNNTHEGDWEMIQLVFDADDAQQALGQEPVAVGYSSHEGAERADWGDEKLDVVDETSIRSSTPPRARTATIPLVYLIAERVSGRVAGLVAAALTAAGVLHLRDSHFFSVDVSLTFFSILAWLFLMHVAGSGAIRSYVAAGLAIGAAIACKYSAAFLLPLTLVAHLAAPGRPPRAPQWGAWTAWLLKGAIPGVVACVTFLLLDPFVWLEFNKAVAGIGELVTGPMTGEIRAIWGAQFTTVQPRPFWFTNLLWWGLGPAFEIWAILGVGWLLWRRDRFALIWPPRSRSFTTSLPAERFFPSPDMQCRSFPHWRVAAGAFSADLLQRPAWRRAGAIATAFVLGRPARSTPLPT